MNPAGGQILGHDALRSVADLPEGVDLAVLCTPASTTPSLVRECGRRGVGGAVVLAVGFGESGPEGARLETELRQAGREHGVRIIGPNTSGLLNLHSGVNLIGARGVRPGGVSLLVQSGNIALALMNEVSLKHRDGVAICCGLGNEADVGFGAVLDYLGSHDSTKVVVAHLEGIKDARGFLGAAAEVAPHKPVVAIKSGRTGSGAETALSHTGAVAGPYDRLSAGLAQAGVAEVRRTDELMTVAQTLAWQPAGPPGAGVAILSDGGGQNVLAVDALSELGATLARLSPASRSALRTALGPAAAVGNPVDVAGAADRDPWAFARALEILAGDAGVSTVLVAGLFGGYGIRYSATLVAPETQAAEAMAAAIAKADKGLVVHSVYASHDSAPLAAFRRAHIPVTESLETACRAAAELQRRGRWLNAGRRRSIPAVAGVPRRPEVQSSPRVIARARSEGRLTLTEPEARQLLAEHGMTFEAAEVAASPAAAVRAAAKLRFPVALKLVSGFITHKSDAGGVILDVGSADATRRAFDQIAASARAHARANGLPEEERYSVMVSRMLEPPVAELLVGTCRDPQLGPVLTVGAGGTWVELLDDVAHRVLPVDAAEVAAMIGESKAGSLLAGARGRPPGSLERVAGAAAAVASCIWSSPELAEVEVNPLFAYADRAVAADARIVLGNPRSDARTSEDAG